MQTLRQDISYAFRQMRLSPVFTLTAMLTLPWASEPRLRSSPSSTRSCSSRCRWWIHPRSTASAPATIAAFRVARRTTGACTPIRSFFVCRQRAPEFDQMAAFQAARSAVQCAPRASATIMAKPLRGEFVTGNYFSTFGIRAFAGRTITPSDDRSLRSTGGHAELSRLAATIQFRSCGRWIDVHRRRPSFHHRRDCPAGLLRRNAAQQSARVMAATAAGTIGERREFIAKAIHLSLAAGDRQDQAGREHRRCSSAPYRYNARNGCSTTAAGRPNSCR